MVAENEFANSADSVPRRVRANGAAVRGSGSSSSSSSSSRGSGDATQRGRAAGRRSVLDRDSRRGESICMRYNSASNGTMMVDRRVNLSALYGSVGFTLPGRRLGCRLL